MNSKTHYSERVHDTYYEIDHPTGLKIFVYPREGCRTAYALFGTKYGSVDTSFRRSDEKDICRVPEGIAHYLEHKLFENEDCDAFARYAKTGASANAYTSFDMTGYLFSCTDNFKASLEILLDFVQDPYFTEETVQKEQGIIGQEIKMYDDEPNWKVFFNLLGAMYHNHPVKIDIAGTVESIAQITPELLYRCYNTFYNLNNMVLCVAGNATVEDVLEVADRMLKDNPDVTVEKEFEDEPDTIVQPLVEEHMSVSVPLFNLGYKEKAEQNRMKSSELVKMEIALDAVASDYSKLYRRLLDEELINEASFSFELFDGPGYTSVFFSGESKDPKRTAEIIKEEINECKKNGIDVKAFERAKKAAYGKCVSGLNNPDNIANTMMGLYFADREMFDYIDSIAELTLDDVNAALKTMMDEEKSSLSIIYPIEEGGDK